MKLRRAANHTVFEITDDERPIARAFFGIALDETVVHEAVKAVMPALVIKSQQMIPEQRQFFLPAQCANGPSGRYRMRRLVVVHVNLLVVALEEASNP